MQPPTVKAFRKRLMSYGYKDISIKKLKTEEKKDSYIVTAKEPLADTKIEAVYNMFKMHHSFKKGH